ncbi:MAG: TRAP transporter substrate-binding protein [Deltaproteobacteria bacterium]|nr:TRAP transporter substrate-binding protein [Deltaproteobacteria bacterium]
MEKKRSMCLVVVFVFVFSLFGLLGSPTVSAAEKISFSLAHFFPPTHFADTQMMGQWIKEVEIATRGQVKITVYPGGTLLKPKEIYDGVVTGSADIGVGVFAYNRGRFPVMEGFELPGIYFGSCTATALVAEEGVKKFKPKELSDTKLMYFTAAGPGSLYSKKPVRKLSDLKGMRIRATGLTAKSIKALGAVPVAMPMPEAYEALSKGVVDGNIGPPEILKGWKQAEVTKYITILPPVYNALFYCVMNLKKWNSLPPGVRYAIEKVNQSYSLLAGQIWDAQMKENGIDYGVKKHGMKIIRLPDKDYEKATSLLRPIQDEYVEKANKKGLPGRAIVGFVKERAAVYSKWFPAGY